MDKPSKNTQEEDFLLPPLYTDEDPEEDGDRDFTELLKKFIEEEGDNEEDEEYGLYCNIDANSKEYTVESVCRRIVPRDNHYVHIDIKIPESENPTDLYLVAKTEKCSKKVEALFDENNIPLFKDFNRLHVAPFLITTLFDDGYCLKKDDRDHIHITLYAGDKEICHESVRLDGPYRYTEDYQSNYQGALDILDSLHAYQGWENFKGYINNIIARRQIGIRRAAIGLNENPPRLHTAVIGNPGTGKTSAVQKLAKIYKELGYLDTDRIWTTTVSKLCSTSVNGEISAITSLVDSAQGGTLIIDRAHELYKTDKNNYDTEGHIIKALIDAINDTDRYRRWMLVIIGEPEGMEHLLASNPNLKRCMNEPIYMEDFKPEELYRMIDKFCLMRKISLSDEARKKFQTYILHQYNRRSSRFTNATLVQNMIDESIIPAMYKRLSESFNPSRQDLELVLPEDIPTISKQSDHALDELDELIGLEKIKRKVRDYLNAIKLASRRLELGLPTHMPRMHMAFLGNPGTGKTSVAEIIGKVFASWGILSNGRVIHTEKSQMVGQYIGETELKMKNLIERARGNILFIDEAYQLVEGGEKDFGRIVMNSLLTELGKDNLDMVVIVAGYTAPMKKLLESNEGIESRFPNVFNFEDYTTDELLEIGKLMIKKQGFSLTEGALKNMKSIIQEESNKPSPRFGNGRFVSNLLQNEILASLGARTSKIENPSKEELSTILPEDVIADKALKDVIFDDIAIDAALSDLDSLAGLDGVKKAIHNFVRSSRYLHAIGEPYVGKGLLSWQFVGNSGTGKSTVASYLARILRGMRLISNSHITEIKGERIIGVSEHDCDEVLKEAVKKSCNGLIFIDIDGSKFRDNYTHYGRNIEQIRLKLKELTVESGGECALIVAELDSPNKDLLEQFSKAGIYEFDHTLVFKDFTPDELFQILCQCLNRFNVSFNHQAEEHIRSYLSALCLSSRANARMVKLISRTIYQQVVLREAGLSERPTSHQVLLEDVEMFKWNKKKEKIGFQQQP